MMFSRQHSTSAALCLFCAALSGLANADDAAMQTAWGHPDLGGMWDYRTLTPLERPAAFADKAFLTPEEARGFREMLQARLLVDERGNRDEDAAADLEGAYNDFWFDWGEELSGNLRTSLIIDPPDGRLPPLTEAAEAYLRSQNEHRDPPVRDMFSFSADVTRFRPAGPESLGLSERCLVGFNAGPPLVPSSYNNNLRIIQTPDHVLLVTEMIHNARVVPIDGRPHLPEKLTLWSGDARGRWEDQTLVVETRNFTNKVATYQLPATSLATASESGAVGSKAGLVLVEKFTRTGPRELTYEYTIDDPNTFTKPFTVAIPMQATDAHMFEYACHEGNYAIGGMLRGARLLEREAADKALSSR